jgi:hypothetical protein
LKAGLYVEKWCSNNSGVSYGDVGAAHFKAIKVSGASNLSALTATARKLAGSGDVIGAHLRAIASAPITGSPGGSLYGAWIVAQNSGGAGDGHYTGIEINTIETHGDAGHWEAFTGPAPKSTGLWFALHESTYNNTAMIATAEIGPSAAKWHTGLFIGQDTIVPNASGRNEGILIRGGSTSGNGYTGIRLAGHQFVGLRMDYCTFSTGIAILVPNNAFISAKDTSDSTVALLNYGPDNIARHYGGHSGGQLNTPVGTACLQWDDGDVSNRVSVVVAGALRRVYAGDVNSGGSGYRMLRVLN